MSLGKKGKGLGVGGYRVFEQREGHNKRKAKERGNK